MHIQILASPHMYMSDHAGSVSGHSNVMSSRPSTGRAAAHSRNEISAARRRRQLPLHAVDGTITLSRNLLQNTQLGVDIGFRRQPIRQLMTGRETAPLGSEIRRLGNT